LVEIPEEDSDDDELSVLAVLAASARTHASPVCVQTSTHWLSATWTMACDSAGHHDCNTNAHMANHAGIERLRNRFMRQMIKGYLDLTP
jgi:hypothetical protein